MARQRISEWQAKVLFNQALGLPYAGISVDTAVDWEAALAQKLQPEGQYVVKVDQGVKGRLKRGLVKLGLTAPAVVDAVAQLSAGDYRYCLVEPQVEHTAAHERYLAFNLTRAGTVVSWARHGGIEVEAQAREVKQEVLTPVVAKQVERELGLPPDTIGPLEAALDAAYGSFAEFNPLVVGPDGNVQFLDCASR